MFLSCGLNNYGFAETIKARFLKGYKKAFLVQQMVILVFPQ